MGIDETIIRDALRCLFNVSMTRRRMPMPATRPPWPKCARAENANTGFGMFFPSWLGSVVRESLSHYGIQDLEEACDYLRDPVLRSHYEEITAAVAEQLEAGVPLERLMGGSIDAFKLASSLTLFSAAASRLADEASSALARRCDTILRTTTPQGYPACSFTIEHVTREG